jgi:SAM-dependent methyltransferase
MAGSSIATSLLTIGAVMAEQHDPELYGEVVADKYDVLYADAPETLLAVERLSELSQGGPVYELGVGTGRLALPLVERGLEVHGTESSELMVSKLRAKPHSEAIRVTIGDFSKVVPSGGPFSLAFLVFNTIFAVADTSTQIACFELVSQQLRAGGRFVVEAFVIDPQDFRHGRAIEIRTMSAERVELQLAEYDADQQKLHRVLLNVLDGEIKLHVANDTYAAPRELDLMARMAGLDLDQRWSDWTRAPFTSDSARHVSVYKKR